MGRQYICLPDRLTDQTTTRHIKRRKRRIRTLAEHSWFQCRPPLMGTLGVHQNIPASNTKLSHSLGKHSIYPPLVMDKLIPVKSRAITSPPEMGPVLDVECKPAVISKRKFIHIMLLFYWIMNFRRIMLLNNQFQSKNNQKWKIRKFSNAFSALKYVKFPTTSQL